MGAGKGVAVSIARTAAAAVAGWLIAWGAAHGLGLNESLRAPLAGLVFVGFTVAYHTLIRLAETYISPRFGLALGIPRPPAYPPVTPAAPPGFSVTPAPGTDRPVMTGGVPSPPLTPPPPGPPVSS